MFPIGQRSRGSSTKTNHPIRVWQTRSHRSGAQSFAEDHFGHGQTERLRHNGIAAGVAVAVDGRVECTLRPDGRVLVGRLPAPGFTQPTRRHPPDDVDDESHRRKADGDRGTGACRDLEPVSLWPLGLPLQPGANVSAVRRRSSASLGPGPRHAVTFAHQRCVVRRTRRVPLWRNSRGAALAGATDYQLSPKYGAYPENTITPALHTVGAPRVDQAIGSKRPIGPISRTPHTHP